MFLPISDGSGLYSPAMLGVSRFQKRRLEVKDSIGNYKGMVSKTNTVNPVLSVYSKIDKTKVLKTNFCLMKIKVLQNALIPIGAFCNTFDLH